MIVQVCGRRPSRCGRVPPERPFHRGNRRSCQQRLRHAQQHQRSSMPDRVPAASDQVQTPRGHKARRRISERFSASDEVHRGTLSPEGAQLGEPPSTPGPGVPCRRFGDAPSSYRRRQTPANRSARPDDRDTPILTTTPKRPGPKPGPPAMAPSPRRLQADTYPLDKTQNTPCRRVDTADAVRIIVAG